MKNKMLMYNMGHNSIQGKFVMPKKIDLDNTDSFGQRMAKLRHAAGYSQRGARKYEPFHRLAEGCSAFVFHRAG